jgi:integrase
MSGSLPPKLGQAHFVSSKLGSPAKVDDGCRPVNPGSGVRRASGQPHAFRHSFTSAVLDAADGNLLIARDAGGWASAATVDEVYGHVDIHGPAFDSALRAVWGETR